MAVDVDGTPVSGAVIVARGVDDGGREREYSELAMVAQVQATRSTGTAAPLAPGTRFIPRGQLGVPVALGAERSDLRIEMSPGVFAGSTGPTSKRSADRDAYRSAPHSRSNGQLGIRLGVIGQKQDRRCCSRRTGDAVEHRCGSQTIAARISKLS